MGKTMPDNLENTPPIAAESSDDNQDQMDPQTQPSEPPAGKKFTQTLEPIPMAKKSTNSLKIILLALTVVLLGIGTGYGLAKMGSSAPGVETPTTNTPIESDQIEVGKVYGSQINGFTDEAAGVIVDGGINGDGTHRLLRPGGESQIVCLTSDVLDIDLFLDHKVTVWGETFNTLKCGWFMNVGRVEVQELNAEKPFLLEEE